jgi:alpha-galactosidase
LVPLVLWRKLLADQSKAVCLYNRSEAALKMTLDFKAIGLNGPAQVRDLWEHKDIGTVQGSYTVEVAKHGVTLLKVSR